MVRALFKIVISTLLMLFWLGSGESFAFESHLNETNRVFVQEDDEEHSRGLNLQGLTELFDVSVETHHRFYQFYLIRVLFNNQSILFYTLAKSATEFPIPVQQTFRKKI